MRNWKNNPFTWKDCRRILFAGASVVDPEWFGCPGSGSVLRMCIRIQEHGIWSKLTINLVSCLSKCLLYLRRYRYVFFTFIFFKYIFHVKNSTFCEFKVWPGSGSGSTSDPRGSTTLAGAQSATISEHPIGTGIVGTSVAYPNPGWSPDSSGSSKAKKNTDQPKQNKKQIIHVLNWWLMNVLFGRRLQILLCSFRVLHLTKE